MTVHRLLFKNESDKSFVHFSLIKNWKKIALGTSEAWSMSPLSWCPSKPAYYIHRRLRSIYLSSHPWKNYPSGSEGIFGFSWIMVSNDVKIRACFTSSLAARAPSSKADFSTLKCQLLTVRLSQDLVSVDIFESEDHLQHRIKIFTSLFVPSNT